MSIYCIGDIQGCDSALERLLHTVDYSPSRDQVYLLGDLVNRGPESLQVLERCIRHEGSMHAILGNHDLHLLARYYGARKPGKRDTLDEILLSPQKNKLIDWVRQQPLMRQIQIGSTPLTMVHAGLLPQWSTAQALSLAHEVEDVLKGSDCAKFMHKMYGNQPDQWHEDLQGYDRLRVIVNAMTRLRFCTLQGKMDFDSAESAESAPEGLLPWFQVPGRASASTVITFGHWSTLGLQDSHNILAMDTGCVWGGCLSAMRYGNSLDEREVIQIACEAAQQPG